MYTVTRLTARNEDNSKFSLLIDTHFGNICYDIGKQSDNSPGYLTLRLLMSYIYGAPIIDVSRSHITTQHSR